MENVTAVKSWIKLVPKYGAQETPKALSEMCFVEDAAYVPRVMGLGEA